MSVHYALITSVERVHYVTIFKYDKTNRRLRPYTRQSSNRGYVATSLLVTVPKGIDT